MAYTTIYESAFDDKDVTVELDSDITADIEDNRSASASPDNTYQFIMTFELRRDKRLTLNKTSLINTLSSMKNALTDIFSSFTGISYFSCPVFNLGLQRLSKDERLASIDDNHIENGLLFTKNIYDRPETQSLLDYLKTNSETICDCYIALIGFSISDMLMENGDRLMSSFPFFIMNTLYELKTAFTDWREVYAVIYGDHKKEIYINTADSTKSRTKYIHIKNLLNSPTSRDYSKLFELQYDPKFMDNFVIKYRDICVRRMEDPVWEYTVRKSPRKAKAPLTVKPAHSSIPYLNFYDYRSEMDDFYYHTNGNIYCLSGTVFDFSDNDITIRLDMMSNFAKDTMCSFLNKFTTGRFNKIKLILAGPGTPTGGLGTVEIDNIEYTKITVEQDGIPDRTIHVTVNGKKIQ